MYTYVYVRVSLTGCLNLGGYSSGILFMASNYLRDHPFSTYARGEGGGGPVNAYESVQGEGEGVQGRVRMHAKKNSE